MEMKTKENKERREEEETERTILSDRDMSRVRGWARNETSP